MQCGINNNNCSHRTNSVHCNVELHIASTTPSVCCHFVCTIWATRLSTGSQAEPKRQWRTLNWEPVSNVNNVLTPCNQYKRLYIVVKVRAKSWIYFSFLREIIYGFQLFKHAIFWHKAIRQINILYIDCSLVIISIRRVLTIAIDKICLIALYNCSSPLFHVTIKRLF